ncbi:MAG: cytochrome d ubiquinol oxidase subunit II [Anaerolineaceae bacterium]|nr:cytochrome d ubiquinol oxidase subunit II [Anaerolineaceae bacterium]
MDLNILWFILIATLFIGYFVLEGFDYGVGILLPFLGTDDVKRRVLLNAIGPHWDGNEVWLLTAGGAMFAAFPIWYATLFSGFYLPLLLILVSLILRGVAIEFRSLDDHPSWRKLWDWAMFGGSLIPALLWGVAFANLMRGVPIDAQGYYVGGFWNLLNPYALLGGLVSLVGFALHGAVFLTLKTSDNLQAAARRWAVRLWIPQVAVLVLFVIATYLSTNVVNVLGVNPGPIPIGAVAVLLAAGWFISKRQDGWAFTMTTLGILLAMITVFMELYPNVMPSSLNPAWSLTIYNAASGPVTLQTMSIIALIFLPIVLIYEAWSYWIFRKRVVEKVETLHY